MDQAPFYALMLLLLAWIVVLVRSRRRRGQRVSRYRNKPRCCQYCGSTYDMVEVMMFLPNFKQKSGAQIITPRPRDHGNKATYVSTRTSLCGECCRQQQTFLGQQED